MCTNELWELFKDTGDPLCWLLLRGAERTEAHSGAQPGDAAGRTEDYDRRDTA